MRQGGRLTARVALALVVAGLLTAAASAYPAQGGSTAKLRGHVAHPHIGRVPKATSAAAVRATRKAAAQRAVSASRPSASQLATALKASGSSFVTGASYVTQP